MKTTLKRMKGGRQSARTMELRDQLTRRIDSLTSGCDGVLSTAVPGLSLYRRTEPTACNTATYEPTLILFVQGQKRINLGKTTHVCGSGDFLLTAVELPVVSQIIAASREKPLLGFILRLELAEVRRLLSQEEFAAHPEPCGACGMTVGETREELLDACLRLTGLVESPDDIPFLSSLIQREIVYRLLRSPEGRHLRAIATLGEQSHRTAKAVGWLRINYAKPLRVEELASMAQMGVSTLHHHFRSMTAMSPLQYQKQLRLHTARERMISDGLDAASAAFEVGYESASQFSREYSRFFGLPPMRDVKARREAIAGESQFE